MWGRRIGADKGRVTDQLYKLLLDFEFTLL